jgi:hypothetical protein
VKLKYPRQTKYAVAMTKWLRIHRAEVEAGHEVALDLGARTGFVRKTARIMIGKEADTFDTDWNWAPNTFPSPLKALAQALQHEGMVGGFFTQYQDGQIIIRMGTKV